jgi:two-component system, NarL family, nitrate/nitrite response regulator NarL
MFIQCLGSSDVTKTLPLKKLMTRVASWLKQLMRPTLATSVQTIRLLLVDDQMIVREGLRLLLENQNGLFVTGEASNFADAVALAARDQPDLILLDLDLGDVHGLDCLPELLKVSPQSKVLVLTGVYDLEIFHQAVSRGAVGIVRKMEAAEVLVKAIRKVFAGEVWLDGALMARVLNDLWRVKSGQPLESAAVATMRLGGPQRETIEQFWSPRIEAPNPDEAARIAQLTEREREVIGLIGEGLRNQQIADRLSISVITVRHHLSSVFAKLDVGDRFELAIYSYRHGLAKLPL